MTDVEASRSKQNIILLVYLELATLDHSTVLCIPLMGFSSVVSDDDDDSEHDVIFVFTRTLPTIRGTKRLRAQTTLI